MPEPFVFSVRARLLALVVLSSVALCVPMPQNAIAHVFVSRHDRVGAFPPHDGSGWFVQAYLDVPNLDLAHLARVNECLLGPGVAQPSPCPAGDLDRDGDVDLKDIARFQRKFMVTDLIQAERFIAGIPADFTFSTPWIDFPSGPEDSRLDTEFETIRDFLDDYITDVSDPSKLDEPFSALLLRFTGLVKVTMADEVRVRELIELPVWVDFGTMGYGAYRTRIVSTVYENPNLRFIRQPFMSFGPSIEVPGLYPIEITYVNIQDPEGLRGNERAGVEVYSWHGGGMPWPAGEQMVHAEWGAATLAPPRVIYQFQDVLQIFTGDFDADTDVDLRDFRWFQVCSDANLFFLPAGCYQLDFDGDSRLGTSDLPSFEAIFDGPIGTGP